MAGYVMRSTVIVPLTVAELEQGQTVAKGTAVDLPETYGDHLVAEKLAVRDQTQAVPDAETDPDRLALISEIIAGLLPEEFTKGGKPEVGAINDALLEGADPVTSRERDAIWNAIQLAKKG